MGLFSDKNRCGAVIVAAGSASRMQGIDKIIEPLDGEPMVVRTAKVFACCEEISEIVIITRRDLMERVSELCVKAGISKVRIVAAGGENRADSVRIGLGLLSDDVRYAAVHDGARPLVTRPLILRVLQKAKRSNAAAPAIPVKDTIKVAKDGVIEATPDRSTLFAVQTPQIFDKDLLVAALENAKQKNIPLTDECSAVEALGKKVYLVEGSEENIKVTTPGDLTIARAILRGRIGK